MTKMLLVLAAFAISSMAHAGEKLNSFKEAAISFNSGRAPKATELTKALWMATSIAMDRKVRGSKSGSYPNGSIPSPDGAYREIAKFSVSTNSKGDVIVDATDSYTKADTGVLIGETAHSGSIAKDSLVLFAAGDATSCATRTLCRVITSKKLLCAQTNDDARAQCTPTYKKGAISAFLGYSPVHP
jgi:hypothetical protein